MGGSIGIDGMTCCFPAVLMVWLTVPFINPAIETISPACALVSST